MSDTYFDFTGIPQDIIDILPTPRRASTTDARFRKGCAVGSAARILYRKDTLLPLVQDQSFIMRYVDEYGTEHMLCTRTPNEQRPTHVHKQQTIRASHAYLVLIRGQYPAAWWQEADHYCGLGRCETHVKWSNPGENIERNLCLAGEVQGCPHNPQCVRGGDMNMQACSERAEEALKEHWNARNSKKSKKTE